MNNLLHLLYTIFSANFHNPQENQNKMDLSVKNDKVSVI